MRFEQSILQKLHQDELFDADGVWGYADTPVQRHQLCKYDGSNDKFCEHEDAFFGGGTLIKECEQRRFVHIKETWTASRFTLDGSFKADGRMNDDIFVGRFDYDNFTGLFLPTGYVSNRNKREDDAMIFAKALSNIYNTDRVTHHMSVKKRSHRLDCALCSLKHEIMTSDKTVMENHSKLVPSWVEYNKKEVVASRKFKVSLYDMYKDDDLAFEIFTDVEVHYDASTHKYFVVNDSGTFLDVKLNSSDDPVFKQAITNLVTEFHSYCGKNCGMWNSLGTDVIHPYSEYYCKEASDDQKFFCGQCVPDVLLNNVFWIIHKVEE